MHDTFRLTVHWTERIVEVRWPEYPTVAGWQRCESEVRGAVARLGRGWKVLVDDTPVLSMPPGLPQYVGAFIHWSHENGMIMTARVAKFQTRDQAWAALTAVTTPVEIKNPLSIVQ